VFICAYTNTQRHNHTQEKKKKWGSELLMLCCVGTTKCLNKIALGRVSTGKFFPHLFAYLFTNGDTFEFLYSKQWARGHARIPTRLPVSMTRDACLKHARMPRPFHVSTVSTTGLVSACYLAGAFAGLFLCTRGLFLCVTIVQHHLTLSRAILTGLNMCSGGGTTGAGGAAQGPWARFWAWTTRYFS
jgi:hypothetical protein